MTQRVQALTPKREGQSWVPRTHMTEGQNLLQQAALWLLHTLWHLHAHLPTKMIFKNFMN